MAPCPACAVGPRAAGAGEAEQQAYAFRETLRDSLAAQFGAVGDYTGAAALTQSVVEDFGKWAGQGFRNPAGLLASTVTGLLLDSPYSPLGRYQVAVSADLTSTFLTNLAFFGQNFHAGPVPQAPPVVVSPLRDPRGERVQLPVDGDVLAGILTDGGGNVAVGHAPLLQQLLPSSSVHELPWNGWLSMVSRSVEPLLISSCSNIV